MVVMLSALKAKPKAKSVDLSDVGNADDRRILSLLAAQGDALLPARHTRFYFNPIKGEEATADFSVLVEEATDMGFKVGEQRPDMLILEIEQSMSVEVVNAARRLMEHWAEIHAVDYDGWECQVVRSLKTATR
jgi:hypothetical protein